MTRLDDFLNKQTGDGWSSTINVDLWCEDEAILDEFEAKAKKALLDLLNEYPMIDKERFYVG